MTTVNDLAERANAAASPIMDTHPSWCDPGECRAATRWHPWMSPRQHLSRRFECDPDGDRQMTGLAVQLVRLVDFPDHDYVRLEITEPDARTCYHIESTQAEALALALPHLLHLSQERVRHTKGGQVR